MGMVAGTRETEHASPAGAGARKTNPSPLVEGALRIRRYFLFCIHSKEA